MQGEAAVATFNFPKIKYDLAGRGSVVVPIDLSSLDYWWRAFLREEAAEFGRWADDGGRELEGRS